MVERLSGGSSSEDHIRQRMERARKAGQTIRDLEVVRKLQASVGPFVRIIPLEAEVSLTHWASEAPFKDTIERALPSAKDSYPLPGSADETQVTDYEACAQAGLDCFPTLDSTAASWEG